MLNKEVLKQHIGGIQAKLDFTTVEPFAGFAERWFKDQVGRELVDYLANLGTPEAGSDDADLLYLANSCMSWRCYEMAFPHLKFRAGDLGLQKINSQNTVAIAKWEYIDSKEANLAMLDLALENFWQAIEQIRPAAWTNSTAYTKRQSIFIRSATELAEHIPTLGRKSRLFEALATYIKRAETMYIKPILTAPVFMELKAAWSDPDAILSSQHQQLLEAIKPALANLALYEAYLHLPLFIDVHNLSERRSTEGTVKESAPEKSAKNSQYQQLFKDGQMYLAELQEYLQATASAELWPSYYEANKPKPNEAERTDLGNSSLVIL